MLLLRAAVALGRIERSMLEEGGELTLQSPEVQAESDPDPDPEAELAVSCAQGLASTAANEAP